MKKFLSLALALVMALSLFTVASAVEYKDLTDKSEITYSEAVAVLNKLGIIEGYEDGSFKPDTALNRAQAAKIMCGLLLGQETADKLTVTTAPFKDVSADYWAAAYISYCKNAKILDGYSDGTFKPTATLTGYQFCKMLLTALGYDSETEGFVGSGWTLNVAKVTNINGLTAGNNEFGGNSAVTREEACLYALNMLKATCVTYDGLSIDVSTGDSNVSINNTKAYKVENTGASDGNIYIAGTVGGKDGFMQFAEEHFTALKMVAATGADDFGRPANSWTYKNVTVGTYGVQADFTYTAKMYSNSDSASTKLSKLGLKGYKLAEQNSDKKFTEFYIDGVQQPAGTLNAVVDIANQTKNGVKVEVFVSDYTADEIIAVVVTNTYLAQIDRISTSSKTVKLTAMDPSKNISLTVTEDDDVYAGLSQMKADDYVLVTYYTKNKDKVVASYSVPEVVTGSLTKLANDKSSLTVGGTSYNVAEKATAISDLNSTSLSSKQECKLFLDSYGYAIYIKDVTASSNYISYLKTVSTLVDGVICHSVQGIGTDGNVVSLNIGDSNYTGSYSKGDLLSYTTASSTNQQNHSAEYDVTKLETTASSNGAKYAAVTNNTNVGGIKAGDAKLNGLYYAEDVKFIFIDQDSNVATVKDGVQKVELDGSSDPVVKALLTYNEDTKAYEVKAVFVGEAAVETGASVAYVSKQTGTTLVDGKTAYVYTIYFDGVETKDCVSKNSDMAGKFVTYSESDGVYTLAAYTKTTAATSVAIGEKVVKGGIEGSRYMVTNNFTAGNNKILNVANAEVIDLSSGNNFNVGSVAEMNDVLNLETGAPSNIQMNIIYNGSSSSSNYLQVSYIFITGYSVA